MTWARRLHAFCLCLFLIEEILVLSDVLDAVVLLIDQAITRRRLCLIRCAFLEEDVHRTVAIAQESRVGAPVVRHVHALCPACTASGGEVSRGKALSLRQGNEVILNLSALRTAGHGSRLHNDGALLAVSIVSFDDLHVAVAAGGSGIGPLVCGTPFAG